MGGTRYCANIGRQHKSNGVYYVVDVAARQAYQKCHDPDCRGFASLPRDVPGHFFRPADWNETGALIRAQIESGELISDAEMLQMLALFDGQSNDNAWGSVSDDALLQLAEDLGI